MNLWINIKRADLEKTLAKVHTLMVNDEEAYPLSRPGRVDWKLIHRGFMMHPTSRETLHEIVR